MKPEPAARQIFSLASLASASAQVLAEPVASRPEQFGAFMTSERAKYEKVVKAPGARVD